MVKNQARGPTSFFGTPLHREELRGDDSCSSSFDRHQLVVGALPGIGGTQLIDDHEVTGIAPLPGANASNRKGWSPGEGYLSRPQTGVAR
jgi:hypothetical protein